MGASRKSLLMCGGAGALLLLIAGPASAQTAPSAPPNSPAPASNDPLTGAAGEPAGQTQNTTTAPATGADEGSEVGEIVVTARRRAETLIEVPVVVTVLNAEQLTRNRADDLTKIGELTPTVIVGAYRSNGGGSIGIRGISSPANQTGFEQAVSVAIDGVQTSDGRVAQLGFFDLQQVEILKGPQALFFGKNSPAGVISINSAGATDEFQASARTSYELVGDEFLVEGAVSGPLSDVFSARLAVRYRNLDGWLRNTALPQANPFYRPATGAPIEASVLPGTSDRRPGDEEILGRLTLTGEFSPNLRATLKVFGAKGEDPGPGVATQNIGPCTGPNPRYAGVPDPAAECVVDRRTTQGDVNAAIARTMRGGGDGRPYGDLTATTVSLNVEYDFGALTLASTTGYNKTEYEFFSGLDQTSFSQLAFYSRQTNEEFSEEVRLSSDFAGPFNFLVGAFFQSGELFLTNDTKTNDGSYNAAANRYVLYEDVATQEGQSSSVFGQLIYDLTPEIELAAGARYTREEKTFDHLNLYGIGGFNTATNVYPGSSRVGVLEGEFEDENISPEVTVSYRPRSNLTFFGAYKTGFKSGGFGLTNPLQRTTRIGDVDFDSEKVKGFEAGAKGVFLNNRLRANAAVYAFDFDNLQVNTYDPAALAYTINNAGSVEQRGIELDANFRVNDYLTLRGAVAHVNARFRDFVGQCYAFAYPAGTARATAAPPPGCEFRDSTTLVLQQNFDGRAPARSPDYAGNAGFTFGFPSGNYRVEITGDAYYSDSYFAAEAMAPSTLQESFWRYNAGVRLATEDDRFSLAFIGRNLSDKYYLLYAADRTGGAGVPLTIGEQRGVVSRGREIALQAAVRF
jgi:outer membrane receptor protein involved in Fe transport